jgi:hypothetical protein
MIVMNKSMIMRIITCTNCKYIRMFSNKICICLTQQFSQQKIFDIEWIIIINVLQQIVQSRQRIAINEHN